MSVSHYYSCMYFECLPDLLSTQSRLCSPASQGLSVGYLLHRYICCQCQLSSSASISSFASLSPMSLLRLELRVPSLKSTISTLCTHTHRHIWRRPKKREINIFWSVNELSVGFELETHQYSNLDLNNFNLKSNSINRLQSFASLSSKLFDSLICLSHHTSHPGGSISSSSSVLSKPTSLI